MSKLVFQVSLAFASHPLLEQPHSVTNLIHYADNGEPVAQSIRLDRKRAPLGQPRNRKAATTISQKNIKNFEYHGNVYMGDSLQPVNMVFDTGSDWVVVGLHPECKVCDLEAYDYEQSTTFEALDGQK